MRGDVFAARKSFLDQIGGFDEHLKQQSRPGYHLELSFRAWTCGGTIHVVTCSRVAVRSAQRPLKISHAADFRHIVELSLGDPLRQLAYHQAGVDDAMSKQESDSLMIRRNYLRRQHAELHCKPFSWYLDNVAMSDVVRPSSDVDRFGKMRSASSQLCLGGTTPDGIELMECHQNLYERHLLVEMTVRGTVVRDDHCLEPTDAGAVMFAPCEVDSPRQRWWITDGRLVPVTSPRKCLTAAGRSTTHVVATLLDCETVDTVGNQHWKFIDF